MGHLVGKEIYQKLGDKIDSLPFRVNKSEALFNILKVLYSPEEAYLVVNMPYGLTPAVIIERVTGIERVKLDSLLESLSEKGLIVDICVGKRYFYMPSPMVIGIFEFTMMRTGDNLNTKQCAELFHEYLSEEKSFAVNFGSGQKISPMRALPHEGTVIESEYTEVLDLSTCEGCGKCAKACPIGAIEMVAAENPDTGKIKTPEINSSICIGCGVCSLKCTRTGSLKLIKRKNRVIHPETTFERVILQCLERGTLQNQIFGNPEKVSQKVMKGIIGGFLKLPPVKRGLMSNMLRSSFLDVMKTGAVKQGKGFLTAM